MVQLSDVLFYSYGGRWTNVTERSPWEGMISVKFGNIGETKVCSSYYTEY
jgi:hypothetical protein